MLQQFLQFTAGALLRIAAAHGVDFFIVGGNVAPVVVNRVATAGRRRGDRLAAGNDEVLAIAGAIADIDAEAVRRVGDFDLPHQVRLVVIGEEQDAIAVGLGDTGQSKASLLVSDGPEPTVMHEGKVRQLVAFDGDAGQPANYLYFRPKAPLRHPAGAGDGRALGVMLVVVFPTANHSVVTGPTGDVPYLPILAGIPSVEDTVTAFREGRGATPSEIARADEVLDPEALTIGFARRFATYKRATLLLQDAVRLERLLRGAPVQFIFAGKAHPRDKPGQEQLRRIYAFASEPEIRRRFVFLENYDLDIAKLLVHGADVWLNVPRRPREASGTSGMKAALNGVPQLSTLDGWWHEACEGLNGWAIPPGSTRATPDEWDADRLYRLLEEQVVPAYYERDDSGLPRRWIAMMKHAIATIGPRFSAHRMLRE